MAQITDAVPVLDPSRLVDQLTESVEIGEGDLRKILGLLGGLYAAMDLFNRSEEDVIDDVVRALREGEKLSEATDAEVADFKAYMIKLLSVHSTFGISAKASMIITQHEHVFLRSEIYTDIRTVFGMKGSLDPQAAVLVHMLKIEHRENRDLSSAFFALDYNDLLQLQKTVERAIKKHAVLSKLISDVALSVLDPEED